MNRSGGPLSPSPLTPGGDTFASRYGGLGGGPANAGTPNDPPYAGGPYGVPPRAHQTSPPSSNRPSGSTDMSRPSQGSSFTRPPSSASSIGASSNGRVGFGGPPRPQRDSSKSQFRPDNEDALQRHYAVLKQYLAASLHDEKGNVKPNRARDKLLRLSVTQFMELSTDVYDELLRREDDRLQRQPNVPRFLLPKQTFHPKRNQARQKLSTLPIERFRQLATDVFYELERRIPRFTGGEINRPLSASSNASRSGMRPPPPGGYRGTPPAGRGMGPPQPPYGSYSPGEGGQRPRTGSSEGSFGQRPQPRALQSNTIVPNKSTMVEDDDDDEEEDNDEDHDDDDEFGLDKVATGFSGVHGDSNEEDKERIRTQEAEIMELREKIEGFEKRESQQVEELQSKIQTLEEELANASSSAGGEREALEQRHLDLQRDLDSRVAEARQLHDNLQRELEQVKLDKSHDEERFRQETESLRSQLGSRQDGASTDEYERRIDQLQEELDQQERLTGEVRDEAMVYLKEMRELSRQNDHAVDQEEKLATRVSQLEKEREEWRSRYAKVKAQNKSLRASTMGLGLQTASDTSSLLRKQGIMSDDGLIKDVDVTHFQLAVDELLKVARQPSTELMLDGVKSVIICVQSITAAIGTDGYPTPSPSPLSPDSTREQPTSVARLKAQVTGTANSLITATKQHASASGLSPVALLDAAASNLTASVIQLVKAVGIRPSSKADLQHDPQPEEDDDDDDVASLYGDDLSDSHNHVAAASVQSPISADHEKSKPSPLTLGRSNTSKKANGWFGGWGRKTSVDEDAPATPMTAGRPQDDYDPYR
nr:protein spa2 [Quercus suber]